MSVEVQVHIVPQFKGLISSIEDVGSPLVWQYFYLMLFLLENSHFTTKTGLCWFSNGRHCSCINKDWDTRDLKHPRPLQRNLKGSPRNSEELQEGNSEKPQGSPRNSKELQRRATRPILFLVSVGGCFWCLWKAKDQNIYLRACLWLLVAPELRKRGGAIMAPPPMEQRHSRAHGI